MVRQRIQLNDFKKDIRGLADKKKAKILARFFKTGPGQYGEGDVFLGIPVPQSRNLARKYRNISPGDTAKLLASKIHEERLIALLILVLNFKEGNETARERIFKFYYKNRKYINNWDLVDLSADKIVGEYLKNRPKGILKRLVNSKNLWERRIAIVSTFAFIKQGKAKETCKIAKVLLHTAMI